MSADSNPTKSSSSTTAESSLLDMSQADYESLLVVVHRKAKETAKLDSTAEDVLLAKLACYAIRELHAEKIYPATAIRAMSILDFAEKRRSTGGAIKQAKRETRSDARARRAARDTEAETEANVGTTQVTEAGAGVEKDRSEEKV